MGRTDDTSTPPKGEAEMVRPRSTLNTPHAFPPQEDLHAFPPAQEVEQSDVFTPVKPHSFPPADHQSDVHSFPPPQTEPQQFPPQTHFTHPNAQQFPPQPPFAQPVPEGIPFQPTPVRPNPVIPYSQPWRTDLFGCMDDPQNAIITACFPCVTFGQIAEILDNGSSSCATSGILYSCIAFCIAMPCLISCSYRSKLRGRFNLVESPAPDWVVHCFCEWCALCQEYRELQARGIDPSIGYAGNAARMQNQQQQQFGMAPPMQQRMMG